LRPRRPGQLGYQSPSARDLPYFMGQLEHVRDLPALKLQLELADGSAFPPHANLPIVQRHLYAATVFLQTSDLVR
jgi:hypothetical protein